MNFLILTLSNHGNACDRDLVRFNFDLVTSYGPYETRTGGEPFALQGSWIKQLGDDEEGISWVKEKPKQIDRMLGLRK